ncbi:unnamed protein product [Eruca vesicaria subsp. sativa]|uniref:Uncharacterized protein n=1 Tax=Eruca vesicaria subsp. sativa TaxID=29727 RepID=A0ABC8IQS1_ERUVS|nr:unnamed protein product [Eruca vesicaria subsp. sativa]
MHEQSSAVRSLRCEEEAAVLPKEKKDRGSPPLWYISVEELNSLSSYMRAMNAAINDMASYTEANAYLISARKQKVLKHLGRVSETRIGQNCVTILMKTN